MKLLKKVTTAEPVTIIFRLSIGSKKLEVRFDKKANRSAMAARLKRARMALREEVASGRSGI